MCVWSVCFKEQNSKRKRKLYRSIHFNYTRRGGINAAARDHRLSELKKVNCYSFTSMTLLIFVVATYTILKWLGFCTHALIHTYTQDTHKHTNKINRKERRLYTTVRRRSRAGWKNKSFFFINFLMWRNDTSIQSIGRRNYLFFKLFCDTLARR